VDPTAEEEQGPYGGEGRADDAVPRRGGERLADGAVPRCGSEGRAYDTIPERFDVEE
jgi:hypothetical protein